MDPHSHPAVLPLTAIARDGLLAERYHQPGGVIEAPPRHAHEEVQIGLNVNTGGSYLYRGGTHPIGPGQVALIPSGMVHWPGAGRAGPVGSEYRTLYIDASAWEAAAEDAFGRSSARRHDRVLLPIIEHPTVASAVLALHEAVRAPPTASRAALWFDGVRQAALTTILTHGRNTEPIERATPALVRLEQVRQRLADDASSLRLSQLAGDVGLSEAHLCRAFARAFGLPPHRYQIALRVSRARRLLVAGHPVAEVAHRLGFADHAHLTRWFGRLVGVTPRSYAAGASKVKSIKDVQAVRRAAAI
jgi:AraC-like DNA-binding protein